MTPGSEKGPNSKIRSRRGIALALAGALAVGFLAMDVSVSKHDKTKASSPLIDIDPQKQFTRQYLNSPDESNKYERSGCLKNTFWDITPGAEVTRGMSDDSRPLKSRAFPEYDFVPGRDSETVVIHTGMKSEYGLRGEEVPALIFQAIRGQGELVPVLDSTQYQLAVYGCEE
jgi:hypothetical protein